MIRLTYRMTLCTLVPGMMCLSVARAGSLNVLDALSLPAQRTLLQDDDEVPLRLVSLEETFEWVADLIREQQTDLLHSYGYAIDNFADAVQFSSLAETRPDYAGVVLKTALDEVSDYAIDKIKDAAGPAGLSAEVGALLDFGKSLSIGLYEERERAARASSDYEAGRWIRQLRRDLGDFSPPTRMQIQAKLEELSAGLDRAELEEFHYDLAFLVRSMEQERNRSVKELTEVGELFLYQGWIRAYYARTDQWLPPLDITGNSPGPGRINVFFDGDEAVSITVSAPFGDRIAGAMGEAFDRLHAKGVDMDVWDLKVHKRLCFDTIVRGAFGDRDVTDCGLLDPHNRLVGGQQPVYVRTQERLQEVMEERPQLFHAIDS